MNKIVFVLVAASLLILSIALTNKNVNGAALPAEKSILKEIGFMNILQAILSDPEFLAMSYPEQYKILDDFYKHVDTYLQEEQASREEQRLNGGFKSDKSVPAVFSHQHGLKINE